MATTEAHVPAGRAEEPGLYSGGLWSWVTTVDHKRIGIMYGVTALFFFLVGGLEALLIRYQLALPVNDAVSADFYNQLFTMHGTTMVFLAIMPLNVAFFNYIVPLQIGARDVAFPRLNAFSYWLFLFGGLYLNASFIFGGAPDAGWFGYANLTSTRFSPGIRIDFWVIGLQLLGVSSLAGGINFVITILNMRSPGMSLMRMPLFTWMTLVTSFILVLAFPIITVGLVLLMFDRLFATAFFNPAGGGDVVLWQHFFWLFGHPEVYIMILPVLGIVSDVIPTFSRKPLFGYPVVVYSGILIAFLGFGVWAHHMFSVGLGPIANSVFSATTMLIAIPTGVKIFNWIATMWGGRIRLSTAFLFAVGFVAMFIIGGLSGVMHSSAAADLQQTDSYFVVAHIHYVLFGGAILGIFSGFYYWFPKVTGRMLSEPIGKLHFWLTMIAFNITFFPMHFLGLLGMPRRTFTYQRGLGFEDMNLLATIGAFALGVSVLLFVWNLWRSLRHGDRAPANPWNASTLEWAVPSPPLHCNFPTLPQVEHRDTLWTQPGFEKTLQGSCEGVHMPSPSFWPIVLAFGITLLGVGALPPVPLPVVFVALAIVVVSFYGWALQPVDH